MRSQEILRPRTAIAVTWALELMSCWSVSTEEQEEVDLWFCSSQEVDAGEDVPPVLMLWIWV